MTLLVSSVLCFLLISYLFVQVISTETVLELKLDDQNQCTSKPSQINVTVTDTLKITVVSDNDKIKKEGSCSSSNSSLLSPSEFKIDNSNMTSAVVNNLTRKHSGQWICTFEVRNGNNTNYVNCTVAVKVTEATKMDEKKFILIISGSVVGLLVIIIIIIQTIIIIYYRSRVNQRNNLLHLEQRPPMRRDDTARYSTMPSRKSSRKRQSSCIYQSLENLHTVPKTPINIKDRPPMPLPLHVDSDEDNIYNDGNTLNRMFAPIPPSLDSLPRRKRVQPKPGPKPTKNIQSNFDDIDDYDYADSDAHGSVKGYLVKKPAPVLPKPKPRTVPPKPSGGGAPIKNELDNILRKRNLSPKSTEPPVHLEGPSPNQHQMFKRPPPKENPPSQQDRTPPGLRGAQEREMRPSAKAWSPIKPGHDPSPTQSLWSHDPRSQQRHPHEDTRFSENRRPQDFRPQKPVDPRFEEQRQMRPELQGRPQFGSESRPQRPVDPRFEEQRQMRPELQGRPQFGSRAPELTRTPPMGVVSPIQMRSSTLLRKPSSDCGPPIPGIKRPVPPPPDTESLYEHVGGSESSDDEEWKMEQLKPYHIYNI